MISIHGWSPPPNTATDFQVSNVFFLGYMTPFTAVLQYRRFFQVSPESGGIGGGLTVLTLTLPQLSSGLRPLS